MPKVVGTRKYEIVFVWSENPSLDSQAVRAAAVVRINGVWSRGAEWKTEIFSGGEL